MSDFEEKRVAHQLLLLWKV